MIEVLQSPDLNRVIADGNDTEIKIRSVLGDDYYFRVNIYVENELLIEQSWSKDDAGIAVYNLKLMYYSYFNDNFDIPLLNGFQSIPELYKKVRIEIYEINILDGVVQGSIILPEFFVIKNKKPQYFDDSQLISLLDFPFDPIEVPVDGLVTFPIYYNGSENITVTLTDPDDNILFTENHVPFNVRVIRYNLLLSLIDIPQDINKLMITFSAGNTTFSKNLHLIRENYYALKQCFYLNNFGIYINAYLKGKKEIEHNLKPKEYVREDGNTVTYDVEDTLMLEVNTGYSRSNRLAQNVASSIDVRFLINGVWERMSAETKKVKVLEENKFVYEEVLKFSKINMPIFDNNNTFNLPPVANDIVINGIENQVVSFPVSVFFDAFQDIGDLRTITFYEFTRNARLDYTRANGQVITIFQAGANVTLPTILDIDDIVSMQYSAFQNTFGEPLDTIEFKLGDGIVNSNPANLIFNIAEDIESDIAPSIDLDNEYLVVVNDLGFAEISFPININNPDGFPSLVTWSENDDKITLSSVTNDSATITFNNAIDNEEFFISLRVSDTRGLFTETTLNLRAVNRVLSFNHITPIPNPSKTFTVTIGNGVPGFEAVVRFDIYTFGVDQFALIDYLNIENSRIINDRVRSVSITKIFDINGNINIPVRLDDDTIPDNSVGVGIQLTGTLVSASDGLAIDQSNNVLTLNS